MDLFDHIEKNELEQVKRGIESGCRINQQDSFGCTPLHFACSANRLDIVSFLIQHGADVNAHDSIGYTPLHWGYGFILLRGSKTRSYAPKASEKESLNEARNPAGNGWNPPALAVGGM